MVRRFTKINSGLILGIMMTLFSSAIIKAADGDDFSCDGINYTVISEADKTCRTKAGSYSKSSHSSLTGELNLPSEVTHPTTRTIYRVTEIGTFSFYKCTKLTGDLIIPESVTTIGSRAFYECTGFTGDLTIGSSVQSIGEWAFYGCSGFKGNLTIGESVQSIGNNAFWDCSGFTGDLIIPDSVQSIGERAFDDCKGFTGDLTIGNSVESIGDYAFSSCSGFRGDLIIGNSVQSIGRDAFQSCSGFTGDLIIGDSLKEINFVGNSSFSKKFEGKLVIGKSVQNIPNRIFKDYKFTGLIIGNSVQSIGEEAFRNCSGLVGDLIIPNSVESIGNNAFSGCSGFTGDLKIPDSVVSIGNYAFSGCSGFTGDLIIPNSVVSIGTYAFSGCSGFTGDLIISSSIESIGSGTFSGCSGFTGDLIIPDSVKIIEGGVYSGNGAFSDCSGFTGDLKIPDSVEKIGSQAFKNCTGFKGNLIIGESVQSIEREAFYNCSGFTGDLKIPDSVVSISRNVFENCTGFNGSLIIGNNIEIIYDDTFKYCSELSGSLIIGDKIEDLSTFVNNWLSKKFEGELVIGKSVKSIPKEMFKGYKFTGDLIIPGSVKSIGEKAFYNCTNFDGALIIEDGVEEMGNGAFAYCKGFTSLKLSNTLKVIENSAFLDCTGFSGELKIPDSVTQIKGMLYVFGDDFGLLGAFQGCSGFSSLSLGNSLKIMEDNVFRYCSGFTGELNLPETLEEIGAYAFWGCSGFTGTLVIPEKLTKIGWNTFGECTNIKDIIFHENLISIESQAFVGGSGLEILKLPSSLEKIAEGSFQKCSNLRRIISNATTPPSYVFDTYERKGIFSDETYTKVPLYVPDESIELYQNATDWKNFYKISPLSEYKDPDDVTGKLIISDFSINAGETKEIPINIEIEGDDDFSYRGFQFTVSCPKGLQISEVTLNETLVRAGFSLSKEPSILPASKVTVLAYNQNGDPATLTENLVSISFTADKTVENNTTGTVTITESSFALDDRTSVKVDDSSATVTFINYSINDDDVTVTPDPRSDDDLPNEDENQPKANEIYVGETLTYTAKVNKNLINPEFIWSLKEGTNYVTIEDLGDNNVKVTGKAFGTAVLEAKSEVYDFTYTYSITVIPMPVKVKITVPQGIDTSNLNKGDELQLGYTISPDDEERTGGVALAWSVEPPSGIAEVNGSGHVTTLAPGEATITLTATYKDVAAQNRYKIEPSDELKIHVASVPVTGITISSISMEGYSNKHNLKQSEELYLTATVTPENATFDKIQWSANNEGYVTFIYPKGGNGSDVTLVVNSDVTIDNLVITASAGDVSSAYNISISPMLPGDANDDKSVNVADVVTIANQMVNNGKNASFCFVNADVINPEERKINDQDLTETVNIALGRPSGNTLFRLASLVSTDYLMLDDFDSNNGEVNIDASLFNTMDYVTLTADILIPEGMSVKEVKVGPRASNHMLVYNINEDNILKVVVFSLSNKPFADIEGPIFTINAEIGNYCGDIEIDNISATLADIRNFNLGYEGGRNLSSSGTINITTEIEEDPIIFNLQGIRIHDTKSLVPGIYIVNGKKTVIRD